MFELGWNVTHETLPVGTLLVSLYICRLVLYVFIKRLFKIWVRLFDRTESVTGERNMLEVTTQIWATQQVGKIQSDL